MNTWTCHLVVNWNDDDDKSVTAALASALNLSEDPVVYLPRTDPCV
jgi:hypothetical protein